MENKGESDHFLEILENLEMLEILEILEIPPVKRPLSQRPLFPVPSTSSVFIRYKSKDLRGQFPG